MGTEHDTPKINKHAKQHKKPNDSELIEARTDKPLATKPPKKASDKPSDKPTLKTHKTLKEKEAKPASDTDDGSAPKPKAKRVIKPKKRPSLQPSEDGSGPRLDSGEVSEYETEVTATDVSATEDDVESLAEHEVSSQHRFSLDDVQIPELPRPTESKRVDKEKEKNSKKAKAKKTIENAKGDKKADDSISSEPLISKPQTKKSKQKNQPTAKVYLYLFFVIFLSKISKTVVLFLINSKCTQ